MQNPWYTSGGGDSNLMYLYKVTEGGGGGNPIQRDQYKAALQEAGLPSDAKPGQVGGMSGASGVPDPIETAKKLLDFQKTANQPVVEQLQSTKAPLEQKYKDLVDSIKQTGQVSSDFTTRSTTSELGRRGLLPQSEEGQATIGQNLLPVTAQINSQLASTGMAQQGDLNDLALNIARLQAGDAPSAIQGGLQYSNQVQQANQFAQQLALQQAAQQQAAQAQAQQYALQQQQANQKQTSVQTIGGRVKLIDTQTGNVISDLGPSGSGGVGGGVGGAQTYLQKSAVIGGGLGASTSNNNGFNYGGNSGWYIVG